MSAIFIYPLEGHGQFISNSGSKQDDSISSNITTTTLSANGLSRILEIPISLLDKSDTNQIPVKNNTTDQMFWISTNNTPKLSQQNDLNMNNSAAITPLNNNPSTTTNVVNKNGEVTHSFANRKRSIVKRRKSVLSAVFTAEEEEDDEDKSKANKTKETEEGEKKSRRNKKIGIVKRDEKEEEEEVEQQQQQQQNELRDSHYLTPKMVNIMMNADNDKDNINTTEETTVAPVLSSVSRGFILVDGGVASKFQETPSVSVAPSSYVTTINNNNNTATTVYIQNDNMHAKKDNTSIEVITPKDSAIDLRAEIFLVEQQQIGDSSSDYNDAVENDLNSSSSPIISNNTLSLLSTTSSPSPSPTFLTPSNINNIETATNTTGSNTKKKKISSWSPRRIFQSNSSTTNDNNGLKKKKSNASFVSVTEEKSKQQFNISSLFSLKKSTNNNSKTAITTTAKSSLLINTAVHTTVKATNNDTNSIETFKKSNNTQQLKTNFNYTRLPIHTERAIYRLSHIKLSNPRRSLCDQVTISNLMFWYLSIISQQNNNSSNMTENDYSSTSVDNLSINNSNHAFIDKSFTKKACRIPVQPRRGSNNGNKKYSNKKIRNHQIGPAIINTNHSSNAMSTLKQQRLPSTTPVRTKNNRTTAYRTTHMKSSNSSSEEEDEDDISGDDLSDDTASDLTNEEDEGFMDDIFGSDSKNKKKKKYSIFGSISSRKNGNKKSSSNGWLSSFASNKQNSSPPATDAETQHQQDEDDIPLAMYQRVKS